MTDTNNAPTRTKRGLDLATAAELGDLLHELSSNKETRGPLAKAIKKLRPDSPHAEAFKDVEIEDRFEEFTRKQEEAKLREQGEAIKRQMESRRSALLDGSAGRKYSEDDLKNIEALMQKKGISDYDDGATLYAATLPPPDPKPGKDIPQPHGATWEFPEWGQFGKDPTGAARNVAHQVIGEFMRKRG